MRSRASAGLLLLIAMGCASAPQQTQAPARTPAPTATAVPSPTPDVQPPVPTAVPTVPPPAALPAGDVDPPLVRVLLERSSSPIHLPQPGRAYWARHDGRGSWLCGPLSVSVGAGGYRSWQLGAWAESANAEAAAQKIRGAFGAAVKIRQEPIRDGLTRVLVEWVDQEPADPDAELAALGFEGAYAVPTAGVVRISGANGGVLTSPGEVVLEPAGEWPVAVGSRRYRGRVVARVAGREALVINELNIERYLQGVVPVEMGPSQFPEVDALKAQAVAARTYAVAHLGDHADEGWDLCDTPACQAYHGIGAEHRLSNRAVEESAGIVATFEDVPIDAMYTSTCGGHTENSSELFEGRSQPYLQGVPCAWDRPLSLAGLSPDGDWVDSTEFAAAVALETLDLKPGASPGEILASVLRITGVTAHLLAPVDAESYSHAILAAAGVDPPSGIAPREGGLARLLFLTDLYEVPLDPPRDELGGGWAEAAALAALELRGDVIRDHGEAVPRPEGTGIFPRRAEHSESLPSTIPLWERWRGGYRRLASAEMLPGNALERVRFGDRVAALVVVRSGGGGEADRRSSWREWEREKSWSEIQRLLGMPDLTQLKITRRSVSGRVVGLAAVARDGTTKEWSGFDVRRALQLPETLFSLHVRQGTNGERVVHFLGRGWGHGVGLCQNGAYGLARSGRGFEEILRHYYTGIQLQRWDGMQPVQRK